MQEICAAKAGFPKNGGIGKEEVESKEHAVRQIKLTGGSFFIREENS
jgi:hypothetical protein